jgi:uncharacterized protein involved in exopolysaccharide biosynthesis
MDIRFYITILLRRLPYILAAGVATLIVALVATRFMSPVYSASVRILVETPEMPTELARSTVPIAAVEQLQILQQQITTRDALLALAQKLDIYGAADVKPNDEDIVSDLRSRITFEQVQIETRSSDHGATVFEVSFTASNPVLAAKVTNELAALLLTRNQRQRTDRAGSTLQFFDQEVARLDADLKRIEADILKFKNANKDALPENLDFRRSQQINLQERLISLEREEAELRTRRNTLIATYTGSSQVPGGIALSFEQQTLADLNRALSEQRAIFTEDSPNIKKIRARIAELQSGLLATQPSVDKKDRAGDRKSSFGLNLQLSDIDDRLQAIGREKTEIGQEINALTRSIAATPASGTVLSALERNRANIQTQYNSAIARRAEAARGEQIEMRSDGGRVTLLEEAIPPVKPVSLKPKLIVAVGGLAGIGLGFAFVVLLELLNRTVRRPKDLETLLGTQPLVTIPLLKTVDDGLFSRLKRRGAALFYSGLLPAALVAIHDIDAPLNVAFLKLMSGFDWTGVV